MIRSKVIDASLGCHSLHSQIVSLPLLLLLFLLLLSDALQVNKPSATATCIVHGKMAASVLFRFIVSGAQCHC